MKANLLYSKSTKLNVRTSLVAQWLIFTCQCRGHRFNPWYGKILHAVGQLNPCATTTEPVSLEPVPRNEGSQQREAQTMQPESSPLSLQQEKVRAQK